MSPLLDETDRRLMPVGRNVLRLLAPGVLAVTVLTVVVSVPAGAHAPRIKKPVASHSGDGNRPQWGRSGVVDGTGF